MTNRTEAEGKPRQPEDGKVMVWLTSDEKAAVAAALQLASGYATTQLDDPRKARTYLYLASKFK